MRRALAEAGHSSLEQLARSDLTKSGIEKYSRKLGVRVLSAPQVKALGTNFRAAGGLLIPYWTLGGRQTKFFRVRYLERLPGAEGLAKNPQKYDQPVALGAVKGKTIADARMLEAYYPPLVDWEKIARSPDVAICITEGEKKAACACAHKIPMMALGGVYSFMSGGRAIDFLPSLKQIKWENRLVYIVYDNDLCDNPDVLRAQNLLADRLLSRGAKVSYITIPPGPQKGVDDYIVQHGSKAFGKLIEDAGPFLESQALWKLNDEVVYIRTIDAVVERDTHMVMDTDKFARHVYGNRHYMAQVERGTGKNRHVILQKEPLAKRWVEWESRAELRELAYEPGQPRVIDGKAWNMWNGFAVSPKRGPMAPWHRMLDFIFKDADKERSYFEQWCAYPIIHPGAKLFTAIVLWSRVKRLGKSLMCQALMEIYGFPNGPYANATFVQSKQLKREFNTWARNKQLVVGEEITVGKDQIDADYLKYIITNPTFTIHAKFKDEYDIANHTNFILLSNHPDAVMLEDGDKRYMIHGINHQTPQERSFYRDFGAWMTGGGPSHLMHYLTHDVSMRGFDPHEHAPETTSKYEMIQVGKNNIALFIQRLQDDPVSALHALGDRLAQNCDLFSSEMLYRAFDPSSRGPADARAGGASSLGKHLHAAGFRLVNGAVPVKTCAGIQRLYAVRNTVKWEQATRAELREHFDAHNSAKTIGEVK